MSDSQQRSASPLKIQLDVSMTVSVEEPSKLMAAALASVEEADFTSSAEKEMFRQLVASDPAEALQWLVDGDGCFFEHGAYAEESTIRARKLPGSPLPHPDFSALFTACPCEARSEDDDDHEYCELCGGWSLTANTANCLHGAFDILIDQLIDDLKEHGDKPVLDPFQWMAFHLLPNTTWAMDKVWRARFIHSCIDLQGDLASGREPYPRCTAEEMALHLAIDYAPVVEEFDGDAYESRRDDFDWDTCLEDFFEDHDILITKERPWLARPEDRTNIWMRIGDLRPENWFSWFNSGEPRDAKRFTEDAYRLPGLA
ncbi:hypothetical protein OU415_16800 [Saccharopolyspora sp. WRP15-2]|uniref:Uncharacterized protein n=1 Tax=Saccharopolyspora oryzae TaxID=2997343 RepID=A0ABT4V0Z1_9PSEU|nr:hypothetical protein [Saccharopolyspora oryzae]MDA3627106.1 hypothetical protein [Saccharopolyspora oryzae]